MNKEDTQLCFRGIHDLEKWLCLQHERCTMYPYHQLLCLPLYAWIYFEGRKVFEKLDYILT